MTTVPRGYGNHADFMDMVRDSATARAVSIEGALQAAFKRYVREESVLVVQLADVSAMELAEILLRHPTILKPLLIAASIAARAIERDVGIPNVDTYSPRLSDKQALVIAGYLKPFLPASVAIPTLVKLDHVEFIDKEIRAYKGRWEKRVTDALCRVCNATFVKRKIVVDGESFEIDAAIPATGTIHVAIDIKRIEARRDFHKRIDEIVNKAAKVRNYNANARFGAVIYYPFEDQHDQIRNRLGQANITFVAFAGELEDSIRNAALAMSAGLRITDT